MCRTGKMLAVDWDECKPDLLILGKALSGGVLPVSAVLSSDEVILTIKPGEHGSTYGGNPLACRVAMAALNVLKDENMAENSLVMGERLRTGLAAIDTDLITMVRGRGLLSAIVVDDTEEGSLAMDICMQLKDAGLLAKPTHGEPGACVRRRTGEEG